MTWRMAFANLAAIAVTGVATSYNLNDLPEVLPAAHLPALVPLFPEEVGRGEREGLETLTYDGSAWRAVLRVEHLLIWAPQRAGIGLMAILPALMDAVDAYLEAISAEGTLGGALHEPLVIERVQVGTLTYGGVRYYGVRFRHRWVRVVGQG